MQRSNHQYVTNHAFPMKICYLKDQPKQTASEDTQNPSIAYLSSVIQSQRSKSFKPNRKYSQYLNPQPRKQSLERKLPISTQSAWRSINPDLKFQDKPCLKEILGQNWMQFQNQTLSLKHKGNKKLTKTQEKRKKKNSRLLEEDFHEFIRKKESQGQIQEEAKCHINRPRTRASQRNPGYKVSRNSDRRPMGPYLSKPKTSQSSRREQTATISMKGMDNFQWSRLLQNQNFSIV